MEASAVASSSSLKSDEKETEHGRQDQLKSSLRDADEEYSRKRQRIEEEIQMNNTSCLPHWKRRN